METEWNVLHQSSTDTDAFYMPIEPARHAFFVDDVHIPIDLLILIVLIVCIVLCQSLV